MNNTMDEEQLRIVAGLVLLPVFFVWLGLEIADAEPIQYILFFIGYALILISLYIGYKLIKRIL